MPDRPTNRPLDAALILANALLVVPLFGSTIIETAEIALNNDDYSHGLVLPFVVAVLLWDRRSALKAAAPRWRLRPLWIVLLALSLLLYLIGTTSDLHFPIWISLFPVLLASIGLLFGDAVARLCALPIAILYMAKPLPDVLMPKLFGVFQGLAARASAHTLELLGVPTYLSGNIIEVPGLRLLVEEACSGMRSVITLLTVALIIIALGNYSRLKQLLIVLLSLAYALLLNVVRVTGSGWLAYRAGAGMAHGFMHSFSGLVTFLLGFLLLYFSASLFQPQATSRPEESR